MSDNPIILVVEGNTELNRSVVACLAKKYNVITAFDGQTGLEKAVATQPALIITGIALQSDGAAMIGQLHQYPQLAETPILLLSGQADEALKIKARRGNLWVI